MTVTATTAATATSATATTAATAAAEAASATPCWYCERWLRLTGGGTAALCARSTPPRVRSQPDRGCAFYQRQPGVDDEPWQPVEWQGGSSGVHWRLRAGMPADGLAAR